MPQIQSETKNVKADDLHHFVASLFRAAGLPDKDADLVTGALVEANLRGIDTHGVARVPHYKHTSNIFSPGGEQSRAAPCVKESHEQLVFLKSPMSTRAKNVLWASGCRTYLKKDDLLLSRTGCQACRTYLWPPESSKK